MKRKHYILCLFIITMCFKMGVSCSSNHIDNTDKLSLVTQENKTEVMALYKSYLDGAFLYLDSRGKSIKFTTDEVKNISSLKEYSENVKTNEEMIEYVTSEINTFIQENSYSIIQLLKNEYDDYFQKINIEELNSYIENNNRYITQFIYNKIDFNTQQMLKNNLNNLNKYEDLLKNWKNMMLFYKGILINQNKSNIIINSDLESDLKEAIIKLYSSKIKNELIAGETLTIGNKI